MVLTESSSVRHITDISVFIIGRNVQVLTPIWATGYSKTERLVTDAVSDRRVRILAYNELQ